MSKELRIKDVRILNWNPPGDKWWKRVARKPKERSINAVIEMDLSYREYRQLLKKDRAK